MSVTQETLTMPNGLGPAEQMRRLGQTMGLWNHGYDFARCCRQLFRNIDLRGKSVLEIGCGKGLFVIWAALHGAREAIGLEPFAEGAFDASTCYSDFRSMAHQLGVTRAQILPATVQEFDTPGDSFDLVLSVASINHLDEKSCVKLHESPLAVQAYEKIFRRIARMMKRGGTLIVMDAGRRNFFADLGLTNPMSPNIEWFKHRQPRYWSQLLENCGFGDASIRWSAGRLPRYLRIYCLPQALAYFGQSIFRLQMTRVR
jgi:cyclopropane fatty-acyl-phospholipid synthase-like methyltransferase